MKEGDLNETVTLVIVVAEGYTLPGENGDGRETNYQIVKENFSQLKSCSKIFDRCCNTCIQYSSDNTGN